MLPTAPRACQRRWATVDRVVERTLVEHDDVSVAPAAGADLADAAALVDAAEEAAGAPLVDEAERSRLSGTAGPDGWQPLLARRGGEAVGYAGIVVEGGVATGDLVADRGTDACGPATVALLEAVREVATGRSAARATVWVRHATDDDVRCATAAGYGIERRLLVLGRALGDVPDPALPPGWTLRRYRPDADDEAVVAVLAAAFAGTPDAGWDLDRLADRRAYPWFDPADVLLAEGEAGEVRAVHWTKRRGGAVGEVYVLGVAPDAQGLGLGRSMLHAGLRHLADRGCAEVVLWVDAANDPAVALYEREDFALRWSDVALTTTVPAPRGA